MLSNFQARFGVFLEMFVQDFLDRCRRCRCCMRLFSNFCSSLASPISIKSSSFIVRVGSKCFASLMLDAFPEQIHWSMNLILFRTNESISFWMALIFFFSFSVMIVSQQSTICENTGIYTCGNMNYQVNATFQWFGCPMFCFKSFCTRTSTLSTKYRKNQMLQVCLLSIFGRNTQFQKYLQVNKSGPMHSKF